jgi:hypothetical protein
VVSDGYSQVERIIFSLPMLWTDLGILSVRVELFPTQDNNFIVPSGRRATIALQSMSLSQKTFRLSQRDAELRRCCSAL